jgi:hypothetical protein
MAMTQSTSTLTRGARKLRQLGADAISIPTTADLVRRKGEEIDAARAKHQAIVARQLQLEKATQRSPSAIAAVVAEKKAALALIERLQRESGILNDKLQSEKPSKPLTPRQQMWADAFTLHPPSGKWQPASGAEIDAARAEVDALAQKAREAKHSGSPGAEARIIPALTAAKVKLVALQGPPAPPYSRWLSKEDLKAALAARGVK